MYIIDRYTYYALEFLEKVTPDSKTTMEEFVSDYLFNDCEKFSNSAFSAVKSLSQEGLHIDSGRPHRLVSEGPSTGADHKLLRLQQTD